MNCPECGEDGDLAYWSHQYVRYQLLGITNNEADVAGGEADIASEEGYYISCSSCGQDWEDLGELRRAVAQAQEAARTTSDEAALDQMQRLLDKARWSGADDLETIAELLRQTGRGVWPPAEDTQSAGVHP